MVHQEEEKHHDGGSPRESLRADGSSLDGGSLNRFRGSMGEKSLNGTMSEQTSQFEEISLGESSLSPKKLRNSLTFFFPPSAQLGCKINEWEGCVPVSLGNKDQFNIVTPMFIGTHCTPLINNPKI